MVGYWIGLDGTDSPYGGCTTWTMSNIIDQFNHADHDITIPTLPRLIRLNPNIPYKTRGNGALALYIRTELSAEKLGSLIVDQIVSDQQQYELNPAKRPGLVISSYKPEGKIYRDSLQYLLDIEYIDGYLDVDYIWPEVNQSHIGALAAISADLSSDYTYELLAYRHLRNCGTNRAVAGDPISAIASRYKTVFSSFDDQQGRELIMPAGPDPVFCGIRGDDPRELIGFFNDLTPDEELRSYTIFQTNQATNAHVKRAQTDLVEHAVFSGIITIATEPYEIEGGHVFCHANLSDRVVQIAWFEPTKQLRDAARLLHSGDMIFLNGSVHRTDGETEFVIHAEYMQLVNTPQFREYIPPRCQCGSRMTSAGRFAGYKCKSCSNTSKFAEIVRHSRQLHAGQHVFSSKSAQRHLTRPASRMHRFNRNEPVSDIEYRVVFDNYD